jgi:protease-4
MLDEPTQTPMGGPPPSERQGQSFPDHPAHHELTPTIWHRKENRRLKIALAVESALLIVLGLFVFLALPAMIGGALLQPPGSLGAEEIRSGSPTKSVVVVPVAGVIDAGRSGPGDSGGSAEWVVNALKDAREDKNVKAVVLEVDSPGGSITGSDLVHRAVDKTRAAGTPVVAFFGTLAASGGYYVSAGADKIVAQPTAITGSIGVIMQTYTVDGLMKKIGVESVTVKTGKFKDMGSPYRGLETEEREMLQEIADEGHARFVSIVAAGRGMDESKAREIADGRILTASQALELGLVDELGYLEDAIAAAETLSNAAGATVYRYRRPPSVLDLFGAEARGDPARELAKFLSGMGPAYLMDTYAMPRYIGGPGAR